MLLSTACRATAPKGRTLPSARTISARRCLQTDSSPAHAYLRPLLYGKAMQEYEQAEELEGVMSLVLDRKETKNALSVRMVGEIRESIAKVASQPSARVLLLHTPHPGAFCSGADLRERASMSSAAVSAFLDSLRAMLAELEALPIPSIAIVDGVALGGGAELALGCDMRVGGPGTLVGLPEVKLGIIPGAGGTQRMARLVGAGKAKELIFTGRRLEGVEAERIGFLNKLAKAPSTALQEALILSRQIVTSAPLALEAAKRAINAATDGTTSLEPGLDLERALYNPLLGTEDRQEGLRAFKEKRRARFSGR